MTGLYYNGAPLRVTGEDFVHATAERFGRRVEEILGRRRDMPLASQRQLGLAAATAAQHLSLLAIARAFERDHTTVLHAKKAVEARAAVDPEIGAHLAAIRARAIEIAIARTREAAA